MSVTCERNIKISSNVHYYFYHNLMFEWKKKQQKKHLFAHTSIVLVQDIGDKYKKLSLKPPEDFYSLLLF